MGMARQRRFGSMRSEFLSLRMKQYSIVYYAFEETNKKKLTVLDRRAESRRNVWLDNMMYQARRFVYTIFKSRFLEKWIQSFSGLHLLFWESGECVPPVCDDESGKTIVYTIFKPKFLEKWIHSFSGLHFLSWESGASGLWCGWTTWTLQFSVSITISMLAWTVVQTDVYYFLVPANCLKSDSV